MLLCFSFSFNCLVDFVHSFICQDCKRCLLFVKTFEHGAQGRAEYTEEQAKELVWKEVDKINADAPFYRKIKKVIIRKSEFIKNSSKKLIRFAEENKKED